MERRGDTKDVEASSGEGDSPVVRCPTKSLKAAAAAAASDAAIKHDDDTTGSEDEAEGMTSLEYIKTYKALPPFEVELILQRPLERTPFADSCAFKALSTDPEATQEDFDLAYEEHEAEQDVRIQFRERVRSEYQANGYVTVSDEYLAMRVRNEELPGRMWEEAFADFDEKVAGFDHGVNVEELAH